MKNISVKKIALIPEGTCCFRIESAKTETKAVVRYKITYEVDGETKTQPLTQKYFLEYFENSPLSLLIAALTGEDSPNDFDIDSLVDQTGNGIIKYKDYNGGKFPHLEIILVD